MAKLERRLRSELERIATPGDPTGVAERLARRVVRRRAVRRAQMAALAVAVAAGTLAGTYGLMRVFRVAQVPTPGGQVSHFPIRTLENGRLAYALSTTSGMELHTIQPDGSGDAVIPTPPGLPWLPSWSPDGTRIAVAIFPVQGGERSIWVMNADGSDAREIASANNVSQPSWSPDGTRIAYAASTQGETSIHVVNADGGDDSIVRAEAASGTYAIFSARFSPDGTQILFDEGTDSGFGIFVMDADGSNVRRLTATGTDYDPHWSPDGMQIAFTRQGHGDQSDIYVMNADGSEVRQLTNGGEGVTNLYPTWSPDGSKIVYLAGRSGGSGALVVMNPDGTDSVTLVKKNVLGISWQPVPAGDGAVLPTP